MSASDSRADAGSSSHPQEPPLVEPEPEAQGEFEKAFAEGMAYAARARSMLGDLTNARGIYEVLMTKGAQVTGKASTYTLAAMMGLLNIFEEETAKQRREHAPQVVAIAARMIRMCDKQEPGCEWLHEVREEGPVEVPYVGPMDARRLRLQANAHLGSMHHENQAYDEAIACYDAAIEAAEATPATANAVDVRAELVMALNGKAQCVQSLAIKAGGSTPAEAVQTTGDVERQQTLPKDDLPDEAKKHFRSATELGLRALQLARELSAEEADENPEEAGDDDGHGPTNPMLLAVYCTLGDIAWTMRNKRLAVLNYTHAARQSIKCYGEDHPETKKALTLLSFAQSHTAVGKPVEAM